MQYKLTGKNLEITSAMENILERKLAKLDKLFDENASANVLMSMEKGRSKIEITIPVKNSTIRSEQTGNDIYALIDDAVDALERQMRKAAEDLEFEQAARLRDEIRRLEQTMMRF